jgi:hypothetical protein
MTLARELFDREKIAVTMLTDGQVPTTDLDAIQPPQRRIEEVPGSEGIERSSEGSGAQVCGLIENSI